MTDRNRNLDDSFDRDRDLDRGTLGDRTSRAADKAFGSHDEPATKGDVVGETAGGLAGAATGAALGSLGGPIGTIIGGIAGAVGGWWSGRAISEAATAYTEDDDAYYRSQFQSRQAGGALRPDATANADTYAAGATGSRTFDDYRPAYQLGQIASRNPDYYDRNFDDVEPDLRRGWTDDVSRRLGSWEEARDHARRGFERGREARLTLSREELEIGKQQVQAGEATVRKTVETERVRQNVPVSREELRVERRPLDANAPTDVQIGEDEIRIPLTREDVTVEKRAVPVEEVVIRKDVVTEDQTVEADVRRERLDESSLRDANRKSDRDREAR